MINRKIFPACKLMQGEIHLHLAVIQRLPGSLPEVVQAFLTAEIRPLCEAVTLCIMGKLVHWDSAVFYILGVLMTHRPVGAEVTLYSKWLTVRFAVPIAKEAKRTRFRQTSRPKSVIDSLIVAHVFSPPIMPSINSSSSSLVITVITSFLFVV
jgi:hypothetical protein